MFLTNPADDVSIGAIIAASRDSISGPVDQERNWAREPGSSRCSYAFCDGMKQVHEEGTQKRLRAMHNFA